MSSAWALTLCERLVAWAVFLQALELMFLRPVTADSGLWRWKSLSRHFGFLAPVFGPLLAGRGWQFLLIFQAVTAASVLTGWSSPALLLALLLSVFLSSMRFLGTFNGGSDCMTAVVLVTVTAIGWFGSSESAMRVGLGYIGLQLTLSYAVAGLVKLREPAWRQGVALPQFFKLPQYPVNPTLERVVSHRVVSRGLGVLIIVGEFMMPGLVLYAVKYGPVSPILVGLTLGAGLFFHFVNAWVLGLNRFFWAWLSAYPALGFWLSQS